MHLVPVDISAFQLGNRRQECEENKRMRRYPCQITEVAKDMGLLNPCKGTYLLRMYDRLR